MKRIAFITPLAILLIAACSDARSDSAALPTSAPLRPAASTATAPCYKNPSLTYDYNQDKLSCVEIMGSTTVAVGASSTLECKAFSLRGVELPGVGFYGPEPWKVSHPSLFKFDITSFDFKWGQLKGLAPTPVPSTGTISCTRATTNQYGNITAKVTGTRTVTVNAN